jgi:hypothetical protein
MKVMAGMADTAPSTEKKQTAKVKHTLFSRRSKIRFEKAIDGCILFWGESIWNHSLCVNEKPTYHFRFKNGTRAKIVGMVSIRNQVSL